MSEELEPCPCGAKACPPYDAGIDQPNWILCCMRPECLFIVEWADTKEQCVAAWNTRAPSPDEEPEPENLGQCISCAKPIRIGDVVAPWDDEIAHADCENPKSLRSPKLPDNSPPACVLIGSPALYVSVEPIIAWKNNTFSPSKDVSELFTNFRAQLAGEEWWRPELANAVAQLERDVAALSRHGVWREDLVNALYDALKYPSGQHRLSRRKVSEAVGQALSQTGEA